MKLSPWMSAFDILITITRNVPTLATCTKLIVELKRYNNVSTVLRFLTHKSLLLARVLWEKRLSN